MEEDVVKEELSKMKKITPKLKRKQRKLLLKTLIIFIAIAAYLGLIYYGFYKIELNLFSNILKGVSIFLLLASFYYFEQGYRKDDEGIFLNGVEFLVFTLITLFMTSFINLEEHVFINIIIGIGLVSLVYYLIKTFILARRIRKEHKKNFNDIRDIVEKGDKPNA